MGYYRIYGMGDIWTSEGSFLKNDHLWLQWAIIMLAFLSLISSGSGLNGVDILSFFGCFINTLSPTFRSVFFAWLHLSAYSFTLSFLLLSVCLISGEAWSYCTRGSVHLSLHSATLKEIFLWCYELPCTVEEKCPIPASSSCLELRRS